MKHPLRCYLTVYLDFARSNSFLLVFTFQYVSLVGWQSSSGPVNHDSHLELERTLRSKRDSESACILIDL